MNGKAPIGIFIKKTDKKKRCETCEKRKQWRIEGGGERGDGPGHPRQGSIQ